MAEFEGKPILSAQRFFWVERGARLWHEVEGAAGESCASCHGDAPATMRGVPAAPFFERGKAHFHERRGQLDMSCAQCHDLNHGKLLRGDLLSQGHTNGYPIYATGDESARHLHKLLWHCNELMRSTPFDVLSDEFVALELYLAWRGQGLPVEVPGVRW